MKRLLLIAALLISGCATSSAPPKPIDLYVRGYQAYQHGATTQAKTDLEAAVAANPDLLMARTILGEIYRKQRDYDNAARQYEVLSRADPYTLENHYFLGVSYQFLTRYRAAATAYLRGLNLEPNDFKSTMALGTVYLALGETADAVKYLDRATQLDPDSGAAWSNLGVALDANGSNALAETAYRKAMEREPKSTAIVQNLANNLLKQKKTGEAIYFWKGLVETEPTPFRRVRLAEAQVQGQDFAAADAQLAGVLKDQPSNVPALNAQAASKIRQYELSGFSNDKLRQSAVAAMRKSLSLNGDQPAVRKMVEEYKSPSALGR